MPLITTRHARETVLLATLVLVIASAGDSYSAPIIVAGVGNGVTTDVFDVSSGVRIGTHTPETISINDPNDPPRSFLIENAFGRTEAGGLENGDRALFQSGGSSLEVIRFATPTPVSLNSYSLYLSEDGGGTGNRSANAFRLFASPDGITFTKISDTTDTVAALSTYTANYGISSITVTDAFGTPIEAQFFRAEFDRALNPGTRVRELDGFGTAATVTVDPTLFDMSDLGGKTVNPTASPSVNANFDVRDVFGDTINNSTYIFANGATPDNGDGCPGSA